jgi:hypothetical protein
MLILVIENIFNFTDMGLVFGGSIKTPLNKTVKRYSSVVYEFLGAKKEHFNEINVLIPY